MSRSIQRSKCTRVHCLVCKPHKVTGERPIGERRALDADADLAANGASLCRDADAYDDGSGHDECRKCVACIDCGDCECRRAA